MFYFFSAFLRLFIAILYVQFYDEATSRGENDAENFIFI